MELEPTNAFQFFLNAQVFTLRLADGRWLDFQVTSGDGTIQPIGGLRAEQ